MQTVLLARRAPTIKRWSLDARSEEQSAYSLWKIEESDVLVRRAQLRVDQATLEIELENWEDAWSGDRSSLP